MINTLPLSPLRPFIAAGAPTAVLARLIGNSRGFVYRRRHDASWTMDFVSDGCRNVTGFDPHRFIGNDSLSFAELIHTDDRDRVDGAVGLAVERRRRRTLRYRIRTAYRALVWVEDRFIPVYGTNGALTAIEGVIDLVPGDPANVAGHEAWEEMFADAFRRSAVPLLLSHADGRVCAMNEACVRRFRLSAEEILGCRRLDELLPELAVRAGKDEVYRGTDAAVALGAVSLPIATPLGADTVLTILPQDRAALPTLWWRGAAGRRRRPAKASAREPVSRAPRPRAACDRTARGVRPRRDGRRQSPEGRATRGDMVLREDFPAENSRGYSPARSHGRRVPDG